MAELSGMDVVARTKEPEWSLYERKKFIKK